uniref:Putative myofilin n=1 Tax=Xenopsylla cheopis TaxID=163159 RepID=A0A6M2DQL2_XENCH
MFKNHLDMIGRNETASKKAKFWQSYVRSLKGSDDIRAPESAYRPKSAFRPLSSFPEFTSTWPLSRSIYDDPSHAAERITVPGYRYLPIHRETYGYSPRDIYPRSLDRYRPSYYVPKKYQSALFDHSRAWQEHLDRMTELDARYPSRYGLLLKDRALPAGVVSTGNSAPDSLKGIEYEPDNKPPFGGRRSRSPTRFDRSSVPRGGSLPPNAGRHFSPGLFDDEFFSPDEDGTVFGGSRYDRGVSPTPVKTRLLPPRENEIAYDLDGRPIYSPARGRSASPLHDLLNPSKYLPISAIARDPWWWDAVPSLRPYDPYLSWGKSPFFLRDSYLSPVKRTYLWHKHPARPLATVR